MFISNSTKSDGWPSDFRAAVDDREGSGVVDQIYKLVCRFSDRRSAHIYLKIYRLVGRFSDLCCAHPVLFRAAMDDGETGGVVQ